MGALVYLESLMDHYESGAPALFSRADFVKRVKEHPNWKNKSGGSFKNAPDDCGRELRKFTPKVEVEGEFWRLRFHGPTARLRKEDKTSEEIGFEVVAEAVRRTDDALTLPLPHLIGRCVCCPSRTAFDAYDRFCTNPGCPSHPFTHDAQHLYVTIVPERKATYANSEAIDYGFLQQPGTAARNISATARELLPYTKDHLAEAGLSLGKPLLYQSGRLETTTNFGEVWVLDLASYMWTNTLKDARSWAIVNLAHEMGVRTLALYTAGNAGMSLAKVAYAARRVFDRPLDVYALVPEGVEVEIRTQLRAWGCHIIDLTAEHGRILNHKDVWRWVNAFIRGKNVEPEHAWHVTDGWDGVGVMMYRLLFAEAFANAEPDFAVVPVGTGSLFLGTYLGLLDTYGPNAGERLIGAIPPPPNNILANFDADLPSIIRGADVGTMPKLVGAYSPLAPAVKHVVESHGARLVTVTPDMHKRTSEILARDYRAEDGDPVIAFEPSAAAAAAALMGSPEQPGLRELIERKRGDRGNVKVLVVNTGLGALGSKEFEFLHKAHNGFTEY
ncbi:MAG TPA: pyridoxal-phosphate dependent enzyme [Thermoanaerobaculia bacterium]|nr:pyridoxal-phosphate dependent enzyme [Thermoanaerobaculia bacterium]